jgi:hypothetical protein
MWGSDIEIKSERSENVRGKIISQPHISWSVRRGKKKKV